MKLPSLEVEFCGVKFPNPFCLSSSPVGNTYEMCARAYDMGWGGVAYKTMCLDDVVKIVHPSPRLNALHRGTDRVIGIQNLEQISDRSTKENFEDCARLKRDYPDRVLIASIMGLTRESDWSELARMSEDVGADMIECNLSCPQMTVEGTGHKAGQNTKIIARAVELCKKACKIPVMAKMTPNITDMVTVARAAEEGGADAISLINTVRAITAVDLEKLVPLPNVAGKSSASGYSGAACKPIALRFLADLAMAGFKLPISGMGGIYTWMDAAEFLLMGATTLQVTTAILNHGYRVVEDMKEGLQYYMADHGYKSLSEMIGKALPNVTDPAHLSHETQAVSIIDKNKCIGCGQCYLSCRDAGAFAISLDADRKAQVDHEKCFGCLMCKHICPVDAVSYNIVRHHQYA